MVPAFVLLTCKILYLGAGAEGVLFEPTGAVPFSAPATQPGLLETLNWRISAFTSFVSLEIDKKSLM